MLKALSYYLGKWLSYCLGTIILFFANDAMGYGLLIKGNNYPINERTTVDLFHYRSSLQHRKLDNNLVIRFDFRLEEPQSYGNIFRIKLDEPNITLNVFCRKTEQGLLEFKLIEEGLDQLGAIQLDPDGFGVEQWIHLSLDFDLNKKQITWHLLDKMLTLPFPYQRITYYNAYLGRSDYSIDVADISIRRLNVVLDQIETEFPLMERAGNTIHSLQGTAVGKVENAVWLINDSYFWKNKFSFDMAEVGGYQFDVENNRIIFFDRNKISFLNLLTGEVVERTFPNRLPIDIQLGNSFMYDDRLYIYEVNNLPIDSPTVVAINPHTLDVQVVGTDFVPMQLHHHTGQSTEPHPFLLFGGFGNDRYSKAFLTLDLERGGWDTLATTGDRIMPRYFTSSFYDRPTNSVFLFGGMGNEAGDNTIGRSYKYDLHRLDLNTQRVELHWENDWPGRTLIPTRNVVYDGEDTFYALMYPEYLSNSYLRLYRIALSDGDHEPLGDSIPINSEKIKTNANLHFHTALNTFYAITQVFDADELTSAINIYELKAPVVSYAELTQYDQPVRNRRPIYIWALVIAAVGLTGYGIYHSRSNRKTQDRSAPASQQLEKKIDYEFPSRNAIYLFGKFEVIDKKGLNITHLFSTRLKLLLVLFLSRLEDGFESNELSTLLWPEKEIPATKNVRGVTINQFRKLLANLEGISLVYHENQYRLQLAGCLIDYDALTKTYEAGNAVEDPRVHGIIARGKFLKNIEHELLDEIKNETDQKVLDILYQKLARSYENQEYEQVIHLAKLCLETSPIDTEAFKYEIRSMIHTRPKAEAVKRFEQFSYAYQALMDEALPFKFKDFVK